MFPSDSLFCYPTPQINGQIPGASLYSAQKRLKRDALFWFFSHFWRIFASDSNLLPVEAENHFRIIAECMGLYNCKFLLFLGQGRPRGVARTAGRPECVKVVMPTCCMDFQFDVQVFAVLWPTIHILPYQKTVVFLRFFCTSG